MAVARGRLIHVWEGPVALSDAVRRVMVSRVWGKRGRRAEVVGSSLLAVYVESVLVLCADVKKFPCVYIADMSALNGLGCRTRRRCGNEVR